MSGGIYIFGISGLKNRKILSFIFLTRRFVLVGTGVLGLSPLHRSVLSVRLCFRISVRHKQSGPYKQLFQCAQEQLEFAGIYRRPGNDDHRIAGRQFSGCQPEEFFGPATDPVPLNSAARCSPRAKTNLTDVFPVG